MPRIRDRKQQNQALSVTPWMNKKGLVEGPASSKQGPNKSQQQTMYSVLIADAQFAACSSTPSNDTVARATAVGRSSQCIDIERAFSGSEGWHSVRRKQQQQNQLSHTVGVNNSLASQAARDGTSTQPTVAVDCPTHVQQPVALQGPMAAAAATQADPFDLAYSPSAADYDDVEQPSDDMDPAPHQQQQQQQSLHGVAQLILLQSGTIAGHFFAQYCSTGAQQQHTPLPGPVCLGLHGKQVLGIHSCYRDPEWALLQMSVMRYSSSSRGSSAESRGASSSRQLSTSDKSREAGPTPVPYHAAEGTAAFASANSEQEMHDDGSSGSTAQWQNDQPQELRKQQQQQQQQQQQRQHTQQPLDGSSEQHPAKKCRVAARDEQQQQLGQQGTSNPKSQTAAAAAAAAAAAGDAWLAAAADTMSEDETTDSTNDSSDSATAAAFDAVDGASSSSMAAEAVAWVQRTGGDLVTLSPADLDDEDTQTVILQDNLGLDPDFVHVEFRAKTLLAGAAADARLRNTWPQLVGQEGIVVNVGSMTLSNLPVGWLG